MVLAVPFDTCQIEISLKQGYGNVPKERLFQSWLQLRSKEFRCDGRNFLARKVGKYYNRSQRELYHCLKNLLYLFSVLWFAEHSHIIYLIGFSHMPMEVVKVDIITSKQRQGK